jgi:hypothetical protein
VNKEVGILERKETDMSDDKNGAIQPKYYLELGIVTCLSLLPILAIIAKMLTLHLQ